MNMAQPVEPNELPATVHLKLSSQSEQQVSFELCHRWFIRASTPVGTVMLLKVSSFTLERNKLWSTQSKLLSYLCPKPSSNHFCPSSVLPLPICPSFCLTTTTVKPAVCRSNNQSLSNPSTQATGGAARSKELGVRASILHKRSHTGVIERAWRRDTAL